jgi:hypothetical protein
MTQNFSEVSRESLRMMFEKDTIKEKSMAAITKQVSLGFSDLCSGSYSDENIMDLFEQSVTNAKQK